MPGRREALKQLRRHRIVEAFLTNVMGFGWHEVHEEADRISPTLDDIVVERMAQMAGNPTHCPHGEPIPSPEGEIPELHDVLIPDAPQDVMLEITRVRTREPDRLEYMAALELVPGAAAANRPRRAVQRTNSTAPARQGIPHHRAQPRRDDPRSARRISNGGQTS